jgi:flagellar basal-body rod protein FlgG
MEYALYAAQTAILSAVQGQSVIANNIANITTPSFKKSRQLQSDFHVPGTQVQAVKTNFEGGSIQPSEDALHLAIEGDGFFRVNVNGTEAYTRVGAFSRDRDGNLATSQGYQLNPPITIPADALDAEIRPDGTVLVRQTDGTVIEAGVIEAIRFPNNHGLIHIGDGLFREGPNTGTPIAGNFEEEGFARLRTRALEESNVDLAEEFSSQIVNQRWFQANMRSFQAASEIIGEAVDLAR